MTKSLVVPETPCDTLIISRTPLTDGKRLSSTTLKVENSFHVKNRTLQLIAFSIFNSSLFHGEDYTEAFSEDKSRVRFLSFFFVSRSSSYELLKFRVSYRYRH